MYETSTDPRLQERSQVGRVLRAMRESARISQAGIASILECTQPQVSRFENGRDQPTLEVLMRWLLVCGGATLPHGGITVGSPYETLQNALRELHDRLLKLSPATVSDGDPATVIFAAKQLTALATTVGGMFRKPLVALTGPHNTGTSRICNYLAQAATREGAAAGLPWLTPASAVDVVPSGYDVSTETAYFLLDVEDRPASLQHDLLSRHDVYRFGLSYDPLTKDPAHAKVYVIEAGGLDLLHNLAQRKHHDATSRVFAYLRDRPILRAGVLVDLPHVPPDTGLYSERNDMLDGADEKPHVNRVILGAADKIVLTGAFSDRAQQPCLFDPVSVAGALRLLSAGDQDAPPTIRLGDLYLVATSARATTTQIEASFAAAAHHLRQVVDGLVRARGWDIGPLTVADLSSRMFAFLVETPKLNENLLDDLGRNLDPATAGAQPARAARPPRAHIRGVKREAENAADAARQSLLAQAKLLRQFEPEEHRPRSDPGGRPGTPADAAVANAIQLWRKRVDARVGASNEANLLTCDAKALLRWVNTRFPSAEDREVAEQGALFVYVSDVFEELSRILFDETQSMFHELTGDLVVRSAELPFVHSTVGMDAGPSAAASRLIVGGSHRFVTITVDGVPTVTLEPDFAALAPEFTLFQSATFKTKSTSWQSQVATALARWRSKHSLEKRAARCVERYQNEEENGLAVALPAALRRAQSKTSDVAAHVLVHHSSSARNASVAYLESVADSISRQMALFDATVPASS
jgi:transcriptional regulator with XRE-family HTH domain